MKTAIFCCDVFISLFQLQPIITYEAASVLFNIQFHYLCPCLCLKSIVKRSKLSLAILVFNGF